MQTGFLFRMHGFSKGQIILMSAGIYAGAAQVIALKIMSQSDFPLLGLILTIMTLTLRYSLMSFSIRAYFKELNPKSIGIALFMLMDENWALCSIKAKSLCSSSFLYGYFVGSGLSAYVSYVICTVLGLSIALLIHQPMSTQINFVFIALFVGLLAGSWRGKQEILPCLLSFA
ncbi:MAG: branched-chain amino acid transporter permease, partial [Gammaproteobacteria bacterium]|nr:branched-chain amino acid transporter permease [Gammaproteobacteria bacterium]